MVLIALALMWIYAIFVADKSATADKLNDPAFGVAAEPVCRTTVEELDRLGLVNQHTPTPQERAALVDRTDVELKAMVAELRRLTPVDPDDARAVTAWLADWDQWLADHAVVVGRPPPGRGRAVLREAARDG